MIEHHTTSYAAKFAREKKARPTDWAICGTDLRFVGSPKHAEAPHIPLEDLKREALADAVAEIQRAAVLATLEGRANVVIDYAGHADLLYVRAYEPKNRRSFAMPEVIFTAQVWLHGSTAEPDALARLLHLRRAIQDLNTTEAPA